MDRNSFLSRAAKPATTEITLPDGIVVHARKLSQAEVETIGKRFASDDKALEGFRFVVARCLLTEDGERMLKDEDQSALTSMDFDVIQAIATEVMKFSGITADAKKD
jgi:hypothetical protein